MQNQDLHIYRYKFQNGTILKDELILKYEGRNYKGNYYKAYAVDGTIIPHLFIKEYNLNEFKGNNIYLTTDNDEAVLGYYKAKFESKISEAQKVIDVSYQYLSNLRITNR